MPNTVSVEQAATDALSAWLTSQLTDVTIWDEWPDAGVLFPVGGAVSVLKAGSLEEDPVRPPVVIKRIDDPSPAVTSVFTWRTHVCEQPMQLDVWAVSKPRRDDIVNRLGDALTASKRVTLAAYLAANPSIPTNQNAVEQSIALQLAAPWDHLIAAYQFEAPQIDDTASSNKRREFRATYRGTAFFDRTVSRRASRLVQVTSRLVASPATTPDPSEKYPTLTVTPTASTITRT